MKPNNLKLNKLLLSALCFFLSAFSLSGQDWKKGILVDEFIYKEAPFPSCHSATIAETETGLVAAWFGGTRERNPDVGIWVSRHENGRWTEPVEVANGVVDDNTRYPTWNPVLYQVPGGDLLLFYKVGPKPSEWWGMLMTSADQGKTWSDPEKLPEGGIGPVKNKPVLLENGELLCASSTEGDGWKVHFERTSDFGKTWEQTGPLDGGKEGYQAIQPAVLDHGNGKLQILCRSKHRAIVQAWSEDYGKTWTPLEKSGLPNNNSGLDAVTLQDGRHVLVYNHVLPPGEEIKGPRTPLHLSVSKDGKKWYAALILEDSEISQYSYPSVIQSADGMLHVVYTWRRERIKYVKIDPSKLELREIKNGKWPGTGNAGTQTSDEEYRKPLKEVLDQVETRFGAELEYSEDLVKGCELTYADWRFRYDAEHTLSKVLGPFDLEFEQTGENRYRIRPYKYHLKTVKEGKEQLEHLAALYRDAGSWEKRKQTLRDCMYKALRLDPVPPAPGSAPIMTGKRKMDGYTVENVALELLPGLYVCGSLYRPARPQGKVPVVLCPDGHWEKHRFRPDCQYRCATLARMGAMAFSYDLFAWGESLLQFEPEDHRRSLAMTVQALSSIRILDYLLSLEEADTSRVGITGGSGGGSQTMLITALDDRIKVSVPVVMLSSYHSGGCPCESGMPVHLCGEGTNNVEIAGMAAPRPQLVISDGKDWTAHVPELEFPYLQRIYGFYGKTDLVRNVHLPDEGHDQGISKRTAMYEFMAEHLGLDIAAVKDEAGNIDESPVTIEEEQELYVFGPNGERLPEHAIQGFEELQKVFESSISK